MTEFLNHLILATGIECSYPKVQHGKRRDELESTRHYRYWRRDFELCKEVGAFYVRYGIPYYRVHTSAHRYDWSFCDEVLPVMKEMGLIPILDLCHFGVPDWAGDFQNPDWPELFADFAGAFCERYPWIRYYTPVNEALVCARFSARHGYWNEQQKSDRAMVTAHKNMCRAQVLAANRISDRIPEAIFFQSEVAEYILERYPDTREDVEFKNQLRFLTFDLLYGHEPEARVLLWLLENGMTVEEYHWFMRHGREARLRCIMGMDYYSRNERVLEPDGEEKAAGHCLGWAAIAAQYYERYRKPIMLTETNHMDPDVGPHWWWTMWHCADHLRRSGIPMVGMTWFSLQNQIDWDIQLREIRGHENQNGLVDLDRHPNPVFQAFKDLSERYANQPIAPDFAMGGIRGPAHDVGVTQNPKGWER